MDTFVDLSEIFWRRGLEADMPATPPHSQAGYVAFDTNKIYISGVDMAWHEINISLAEIIGGVGDGALIKRSGLSLVSAVPGTDFAAAVHGHAPTDITGYGAITNGYLVQKDGSGNLAGVNPAAYAAASHGHGPVDITGYSGISNNSILKKSSAGNLVAALRDADFSRITPTAWTLGANISTSSTSNADVFGPFSVTPGRPLLLLGTFVVITNGGTTGRMVLNFLLSGGGSPVDVDVADQTIPSTGRHTVSFAYLVTVPGGHTSGVLRWRALGTLDVQAFAALTNFAHILL